jgi:hypothetical protein
MKRIDIILEEDYIIRITYPDWSGYKWIFIALGSLIIFSIVMIIGSFTFLK